METIFLEVSPQIAQRFNQLTSKEKNLFALYFESWFMNFNEKKNHDLAIKKLLETVESIGLNATERGMTDEILQDILNED